MLKGFFRRYKVTEITFCLPFVQVSVQPVKEAPETNLPVVTQTDTTPGKVQSAKDSDPGTPHVGLSVTVPERTAHSLSQSGYMETEMLYRVATSVDVFGPVFSTDWLSLTDNVQLLPGDFVWLRLRCRNISDRALHQVKLSMQGIDIARDQTGILIHGAAGWPREEINDVTKGGDVAFINPGDDYSLHCVLRVPLNLTRGKQPRFTSVEPEFNILKQLR